MRPLGSTGPGSVTPEKRVVIVGDAALSQRNAVAAIDGIAGSRRKTGLACGNVAKTPGHRGVGVIGVVRQAPAHRGSLAAGSIALVINAIGAAAAHKRS